MFVRGAKDIIMDIKCCSLFCISASCSSGVVPEQGMCQQDFGGGSFLPSFVLSFFLLLACRMSNFHICLFNFAR